MSGSRHQPIQHVCLKRLKKRWISMLEAGRKNGQGRFAWSDGSMYEGGFVDNDINGHGVYQWGDGRKYTGQWVKNRMHGTEAQ